MTDDKFDDVVELRAQITQLEDVTYNLKESVKDVNEDSNDFECKKCLKWSKCSGKFYIWVKLWNVSVLWTLKQETYCMIGFMEEEC